MQGKGELLEAYFTYLLTPYSLPSSTFLYFYLIHLIILVCLVYFTYKKIRLSFLIKSTPTTTIQSAPQGYIEIKGITKELSPVISPLSQTPCVWWSYTIEEYRHRKRRSIVVEKSSIDAFIIKDKTGECIIHPEGSIVIPHHERTWYGNTPMPTEATKTSSIFTLNKKYRYTERLLLTSFPIYCLGMHHTMRFSPEIPDSGDIIREWKKDYGALIHRYDKDSNGELDINEWQAVISDAEQEAYKQYTHITKDDGQLTIISEDGLPNHSLFVLSAKNEKQLLKETIQHKSILTAFTTLLTAHLIYALITKLIYS